MGVQQLVQLAATADLDTEASLQELDSFSSDDEGETAQLLELVGRGAFGSVFKALYKGKLAAVKVYLGPHPAP